MKQSALLEFDSSAFAVTQDEDQATNPGIFGKALAHWVAEQLRIRGLLVGEIIAEDFGWCVPVDSKPHRFYVVCASAEEKSGSWRIFCIAERKFFARLLGKEINAKSLNDLYSAVKHSLKANPAIYNLREEVA